MNVTSETIPMDHQNLVKLLSHACQCRDANCELPSCKKMKRVVAHTKLCKLKTNGNCPICKQLIAICSYHAKHCQEAECPVPFCASMKHKLKQQQLQQGLQQAQLLRRQSVASPVTPMGSPYKLGTQTVMKQQPCIPKEGTSGDNLLIIVKWNPKYPISISISLILIFIFITMLKIIVF